MKLLGPLLSILLALPGPLSGKPPKSAEPPAPTAQVSSVKRQAQDDLQQKLLNRMETKGYLDVRIMLGYADYASDVGPTLNLNQANYHGVWKALEEAGFKLLPVDTEEVGLPKDFHPDVEHEMFRAEGAPWNGEGVIRVTVINSVACGTECENFARKERSDDLMNHAQTFFEVALQKADVAIYLGHSRDGGGPDPFFPKLTADGHTDYEYYHRETPGLKRIEPVLKAAENPPALIAFLSCASRMHYDGFLRRTLGSRGKDTYFLGSNYLIDSFPEATLFTQRLLEEITHGISKRPLVDWMNKNSANKSVRPKPLMDIKKVTGR